MVNWSIGELFLKDTELQGNIRKLWETRWKFPCSLGVYPFHDGKLEDFEPIFQHLIAENINDPYDERWSEAFTPKATELAQKAASQEKTNPTMAIELYKRAATVCRIARFPYIGTQKQRQVYEMQKQVYMKGAKLWDCPMQEINIPFKDRIEGDGMEVPLYVRLPKSMNGTVNGNGETKKMPVLLLITGLDGHRPDNFERSQEAIKRGWGIVICDIPGVADCPALKTDPLSPDRLFTTILNWIKSQPHFDGDRIAAWGLSAGGYYAIRLAHTHADQLVGSVGHGAGTHHYIGREWLEHVDHHEYPFAISKPMCMKYGYDSWEELMENCQKKFSLLDNGILEMKCCRLLLMNGTLDGLMPIEDSTLLFEHGPSAKEARFVSGRFHMGYPEANSFVWPWLEEVLGYKK